MTIIQLPLPSIAIDTTVIDSIAGEIAGAVAVAVAVAIAITDGVVAADVVACRQQATE